MKPALAEIAPWLRCPVCGSRFDVEAACLRCARGHQFDLARQGYVNLLTGRAPAGIDTTDMVAARADLLAAGHFDFLTRALSDTAAARTPGGDGLVVDAGAGTGHYLAAVLDRLPDHLGLALDLAKPAVRRAARAHPRAAAAVCDIWHGLPVADGAADLVLDVFAPRNGAEFRRILRPDGALLVVTPRPDHLAELVTALGLLGVDPDKDRRLDDTLRPWFQPVETTTYAQPLALTRIAAGLLVAMGPSAWHGDAAERTARLARLPEPITVTASVSLHVYRPRPLRSAPD